MMARELNFRMWKKEIKSFSVANHTLHFLEPPLFYLYHYHHHTDHKFGWMCLLKNACGYYSKTLHSKYFGQFLISNYFEIEYLGILDYRQPKSPLL